MLYAVFLGVILLRYRNLVTAAWLVSFVELCGRFLAPAFHSPDVKLAEGESTPERIMWYVMLPVSALMLSWCLITVKVDF